MGIFDLFMSLQVNTFLLLDALEADADRLSGAGIIVEIGSGSGCVSAFLHQILGDSVVYLCTDINEHAARCTQRVGQHNKANLSVIICDLANPLAKRLTGNVDVLIFNPPYVPTNQSELLDATENKGIESSWAGGSAGMVVTDRLLPQVSELLSSRGLFYLVAVKENDIPGILQSMFAKYHLYGKTVIERRAGREHLSILRFHK